MRPSLRFAWLIILAFAATLGAAERCFVVVSATAERPCCCDTAGRSEKRECPVPCGVSMPSSECARLTAAVTLPSRPDSNDSPAGLLSTLPVRFADADEKGSALPIYDVSPPDTFPVRSANGFRAPPLG